MSSMQRRIAVYFPDVPAPARCRTFKRGIASELSIATAACRKESHANDGCADTVSLNAEMMYRIMCVSNPRGLNTIVSHQ